jgi:hypothetical protein
MTYLINGADLDVFVLLCGPKALKAVSDVPAGGQVEEELMIFTLSMLQTRMSLSFSVAPKLLRLSVMFLLEDKLKRISVFTDRVRMLFRDSAATIPTYRSSIAGPGHCDVPVHTD